MNEIVNAGFQKSVFSPADILLPDYNNKNNNNKIDMTRWAVVACDQFTSQPEYWQNVEETVGDAPSALRLILPEAQLHSPDVDRHILHIHQNMRDYLQENIFQVIPNTMIYLERVQSDGAIRHGLIGKIDLEDYDFTPGNGALIRATEGTVLSRIPPRVKVREGAALEIPHVMLLIDDPENILFSKFQNININIINKITGANANNSDTDMELLYHFPLRWGGGSVTGWKLNQNQIKSVSDILKSFCDTREQARKYGVEDNAPPLLFAVGDGNHSLATAKQCYENLKKVTPESQWESLPARYALVEIVNLHDNALKFEPIHRYLYNINPEQVLQEFFKAYPNAYFDKNKNKNINNINPETHLIKCLYHQQEEDIIIPNPTAQLAVGTLQIFLDDFIQKYGGEIDYIHGDDVVRDLSKRPDSMGFLLPPMEKDQLFKTIIKDGVLPRKTFSMGHAQDKRYYIEARKII